MIIQKNKFDIIIDIICLLCLIGLILYLAIAWPNIPDQIPGHYDARGEIDGMTGKSLLIFLAFMAWVMYILIFIAELFPKTWNTGVKVTRENMGRVYRTVKSMLGIIKLQMVLLFTYLTVNTSLAMPLPALFTPLTMILLFGSLAYFMIRLIRVR